MAKSLETRVAQLEQENFALRSDLGDLKQAVTDLRHQLVMLHELVQHDPVSGFHMVSAKPKR